jgi:hypothetical protein
MPISCTSKILASHTGKLNVSVRDGTFCDSVCVHARIYVCMCIYIYTHTHTNTNTRINMYGGTQEIKMCQCVKTLFLWVCVCMHVYITATATVYIYVCEYGMYVPRKVKCVCAYWLRLFLSLWNVYACMRTSMYACVCMYSG